MKLRTLIIAAAGLTLAAGAAGAASAETPWHAHHHHHARVEAAYRFHHARVAFSHRLANQDRLIRKEHRDGDLTTAQARALLGRDHQIRMEGQRYVREHHHRMTNAELVKLNHQEANLHRHIPS